MSRRAERDGDELDEGNQRRADEQLLPIEHEHVAPPRPVEGATGVPDGRTALLVVRDGVTRPAAEACRWSRKRSVPEQRSDCEIVRATEGPWHLVDGQRVRLVHGFSRASRARPSVLL